MGGSNRWLAGVAAILLACGADMDDGAGGPEGAGAPEPELVGEGCSAPDCGPRILWMHAVAPPAQRRITVDSRGRPMWVGPLDGSLDDEMGLQVRAYDPATDVEEVVAGPFDGYDYGAAIVADGPGGLRLLSSPAMSHMHLQSVEGAEIEWSFELDTTRTYPTLLERGPDGTSYVFGGSEDAADLWAITADGQLGWHWQLEPGDDGRTTHGWFAPIAVHDAGITFIRDRSVDDDGDDHQILLTQVENDQLMGELDLARALPGGWLGLPAVLPVEGGWLASPARGNPPGVRLAKFHGDGTLDWYREDPGARPWAYGMAATATRIVVVAFDNESAHGVEVNSYDHDGELRGRVIIDLSSYSDQIWPEGVVALPDGTVAVQLSARFDDWWLVGVQP